MVEGEIAGTSAVMPPNEPSPSDDLEERLAQAHELLDASAAAPRVEGTTVQSSTRCTLLSDAVAVLPPLVQPTNAGHQDSPVGLASHALQTARALMQQVLDGIRTPLPDLFAGLGGAPAAPAPELTAAGAEERHATALQIQLLQHLVPLAGPMLVPSSSTQQQQEEQQADAKQQPTQRHFVGIVEIEDVTDAPEDKAAADAARQRALTLGALLACATYSGDLRSCASNGSSNGKTNGTGKQEPSLFSPWTDAACSEASLQLLRLLAQHAKRAIAKQHASTEHAPLSDEQRLLAAALPVLAEELRAPLFAQQRHQRSMDRGEAEPYRGPGTFDRAIAARRLAWLVRQLPRTLPGDAQVSTLLPLLLAAADDPSPAVQRSGQLGLLHLARVAEPGSLCWQRDLLLDVASRMVAGCDEGVWDSALPAAAALVQALEGRDARAPGYHTLLQALLTEVERSGHMPMLRLQFMHVLRSQLLPALGLCLLRHFARLMPLLLEWMHAHDVESRVAALQCLAGVAECCWPRMHVHAPLIWRHLVVLAEEEDAEEAARVRRQQRVAAEADKQQQGGVPSTAKGSDESVGRMQEGMEGRRSEAAASSRSRQLLDAVGAVAAALRPFGGAAIAAHASTHCGDGSGTVTSILLQHAGANSSVASEHTVATELE